MRIVHCIDEMKMGGAQTHLLTIIEELQRQHPRDEHILFILFGENEFEVQTQLLGIKVEMLNLSGYFQNSHFIEAIRFVRRKLKVLNPDVLETHLTWSRLLVNTAGVFLGIKKQIGFEHGDLYMNSKKIRLANFISQFLFNEIVVCSNSLKTWVKKTHGIFDFKLTVLYNCVDLKKFKPTTEKDLQKYLNIKQTLPTFMFIAVGSMGNGVNKRLDISIKAVGELDKRGFDVGLVICGDGEQRRMLESLANSIDLENRIYFLGNRKDVHQILPRSFAFVHSAPFEPFGIVCIEAMACGLPVILPNSGGIQYIIDNNKQGLIYNSLDFNDLANKMEYLITNDVSYCRFLKATTLKVKEYSVDTYVKELYSLYEK
ncbi:MAG: hypothetical protein CMC08_01930 [Flavobacteriaceae bacterium]|nr:hypothetical protein [Flavobacteriaceae bacterium]